MRVTDFIIHISLLLLMPPLLIGIIARTKAFCAGRTGAPLLQPYYDLARLWRKGSVFSSATTWVFRAGPVVTLAVRFSPAKDEIEYHGSQECYQRIRLVVIGLKPESGGEGKGAGCGKSSPPDIQ